MENAADEDWDVLTGLFPDGWQQEALRTGAIERMRGFSSADVLLRDAIAARGQRLLVARDGAPRKVSGLGIAQSEHIFPLTDPLTAR